MDWPVLSALGVGFALGLKHALDADHLAAVAAMVGERRGSLFGSSMVGMIWGAGHAAALAGAGLLVVVLGVRIPEGLAAWMEFAVGAALALIGGRLLWMFRRGALLHTHPHAHGEREHFHPHVHVAGADPSRDPHDAQDAASEPFAGPSGPRRTSAPSFATASHHDLPRAARRLLAPAGAGRRPFLVGVLHGMAGSAALMLVVLATISGTAARLAYIALFAAGSVAGMIAMSTLVGLPFTLGGPHDGGTQRGLRLAAGAVSLGLGLALMWARVPVI